MGMILIGNFNYLAVAISVNICSPSKMFINLFAELLQLCLGSPIISGRAKEKRKVSWTSKIEFATF